MTTMSEYLNQRYHWCVTLEEDGTWMGQVLEFPGCFATGDTAELALATLMDEVAESWLIATAEIGQEVPAPFTVEQIYNFRKSVDEDHGE